MPPPPTPESPEAELVQLRAEVARLEQSLAEQQRLGLYTERQFRALADTVPHIIWAGGPDGALDFFNQPGLEFAGRTHDELKDWSWQQVLHPDDVPLTIERWVHSLSTGEPYETEFRLQRASDGQYRWNLVRALPQRDESGVIVRWFGTCTDVHGQKEAEQKLVEMAAAAERARVEEEHARLFQLSRDLFCIAGLDGFFKMVNPAWQATLGHTPEELMSRPFSEFVHPDDHPGTTDALTFLGVGEPVSNFENRYRAADGSYKWLSWSSIASVERGLIYAVARDVTRQKHLEEHLRQAQKLDSIGSLAAGIAHDFNNLLTVQKAYLSLALDAEGVPEQLQQHLHQVAAAGDRAAALTRQLLLFSRKQILQMKSLSLHEVVHNLATMLRRILGEDITLEIVPFDVALQVRADGGMLEQVLMNLAVNARDAMPRGGKLRIAVESMEKTPAQALEHPAAPSGPFVRITVQDSGQGIPAPIQERIFEPFFTTKEIGQGTGLGLATAYGIVKQHDGWFELESAPGEGATFHIFLPEVRAPAPLLAAREAEPATLRGHETVLLVEDEEPLRVVVQSLLRAWGYRVLAVTNGPEALALWESEQGAVELLLTDMVMPGGLSGRDVAAHLRAQKPTLKVILSSGYSGELLAADLEEPGLTAFLQKPYLPKVLQRLARELLDGP